MSEKAMSNAGEVACIIINGGGRELGHDELLVAVHEAIRLRMITSADVEELVGLIRISSSEPSAPGVTYPRTNE